MRRRRFLQVTTGGLAGILASGRAPARAQAPRIHLLHWPNFIPEADVELRRQIVEYNKQMKTDVFMENINGNDIQARITSAVQSGAGPDIFMMLHNWPHLYANALADVSDLAEWKGKDQGGYYFQSESAAKDSRRWLALPYGIVGNQIAYRKSWLADVAAAPPKTLDEYRKIGAALKKKGHPVGQTLGHTYGDAPTWTYPLLWTFGGAETDPSGKKVVLNSKNTVESVKWMTAFWKEACDEAGLAWDDTNNNRAFHAGEIGITLNGASIYIFAKRNPEKIKDEKGEPMWRDVSHFNYPDGPNGKTPTYHLVTSHAVMKYSKNVQAAKEFLKHIHGKEQFGKWFEISYGFDVGASPFWENHPLWNSVDEAMKPYRYTGRGSRMMGFAGSASARAGEAYTKYIITDMYAKAVQGMSAEDAVRWAEGELKRIYEA